MYQMHLITYRDDYMIWSDVQQKLIARAHTNGSNVQILAQVNVTQPG